MEKHENETFIQPNFLKSNFKFICVPMFYSEQLISQFLYVEGFWNFCRSKV